MWGTLLNPYRFAAAVEFDSLYQSKQALTTVQKQRFVEWFSGTALEAIWTTRNLAGVNTYSMADAVDEGFDITTAGGNADYAEIDFNDFRHYVETACICIFVGRRVGDNTGYFTGLTNDTSNNKFHTARYEDSSLTTNKSLGTVDGTAYSSTGSDVARDTAWTGVKIECGSANIKLYLAGVLKITKTTNRPAAKLQPFVSVFGNNASVAQGRTRYFEAYNT